MGMVKDMAFSKGNNTGTGTEYGNSALVCSVRSPQRTTWPMHVYSTLVHNSVDYRDCVVQIYYC